MSALWRARRVWVYSELWREWREAAKTVVMPCTYATLFYTLYYLVEVRKDVRFTEYFETIKDRLHKHFFIYGLWAVGHELFELKNAFNMISPPGAEEEIFELEEEIGLSIVYEDLDERGELKPLITKIVSRSYPTLSEYDRRELVDIMYRFIVKRDPAPDAIIQFLEEEFDAYSKPYDFLRSAELIFSINPKKCGCAAWAPAFGGRAWATISRGLMMRKDLTKAAWVDLAFSLHHNTGAFLLKYGVSPNDRYVMECILDTTVRLHTEFFYAPRALKKILDIVASGENYDKLLRCGEIAFKIVFKRPILIKFGLSESEKERLKEWVRERKRNRKLLS